VQPASRFATFVLGICMCVALVFAAASSVHLAGLVRGNLAHGPKLLAAAGR
jgi:hypothetical protein